MPYHPLGALLGMEKKKEKENETLLFKVYLGDIRGRPLKPQIQACLEFSTSALSAVYESSDLIPRSL